MTNPTDGRKPTDSKNKIKKKKKKKKQTNKQTNQNLIYASADSSIKAKTGIRNRET